jgi:hypothetical protein
MLSPTVQRVQIEHEDGRRLSWEETILLWADPDFAIFYSGLLAAAPFEHFFWECPPVTATLAADLPFEHVVVKARGFAQVRARFKHIHIMRPSAEICAVAHELSGSRPGCSPPLAHYSPLATHL